jgi:hypothetical protein
MNDLYLLAIFTAVSFAVCWIVDARRPHNGI